MHKESIINFIKEHKEALSVTGLLFICYFLYFFSMGHYPLIDVDETRYVTMSRELMNAKDMMTLYLNGDYFFEKPPLYFWTEIMSFSFFKEVNEITARIPVALTAVFGVFITYFLGRKISSKKYGMISALILATSFEYIVLARVAILDMLLSVFIAASVFSGIYTLFCTDTYKKYFWWLAYICAGFGLMAKGIPGVAIPAITILVSYIIAKKWKEIFNPIYIIPGLAFFVLVSFPWHMIMIHRHGQEFIHEYILKHHFARFLNSNELGRKQPLLYFVPVFFLGFMPWIFSFIAQIIVYIKKSFKNTKLYFAKFNDLQPLNKFILINTVFFAVTFIFYSLSSTKLPTYILPAMFPAALILGKFWFDYICKDENERAINISTLVLNFCFLITGFVLLISAGFVQLPDRAGIQAMQLPGFIIIVLTVLTLCLTIFKDKKLWHFLTIVSFMSVLSIFAARMIFPYVTSFGQNELITYARLAVEDQAKIVSAGFGKRYSILFYGNGKAEFRETINFDKQLPKNTYVIIRNKDLKELEKSYKYERIKKGKKYSLYKNIQPIQ